MLRGRFPRFQKARKSSESFRNLDNLHVIPTQSSVITKLTTPDIRKPVKLDINYPSKSNVCKPSGFTSEPIILEKESQEKWYDKNSESLRKLYSKVPQTRKSKKQRKRDAKRLAALQARKQNSYDWYNPNYVKPTVETENNGKLPGNAPAEENLFEEVEVASYEYEGQQEIPVGFRRSKVQYLKYKNNFFKPKIYNIGAHRVIVNCLSVQDNQVADVDVVSEAEYEAEPEVEILDVLQEPKVKKKLEDNDQHLCNELSRENPSKSDLRIYKTCIDNNDLGLLQGKTLIQNSLDAWKSHLIGLEYLIEIQSEKQGSVASYHCVLCNEDLLVEGLPAVCVINHINKYKHIVKYLARHFPAYGYRFTENDECHDSVIIQKICEEINRSLGFYYMCIIDLDNYKRNKEKVDNIIYNALHSNEKDAKFDKSIFQKTEENTDAILAEDVSCVINDIITKVLKSDKINAQKSELQTSCTASKSKILSKLEATSISKTGGSKNSLKITPENHNLVQNDEKKTKAVKSTSKFNTDSAMSSYFKLNYFTTKFKSEDLKKKPKEKNDEQKIEEQTLNKNSVSEISKIDNSVLPEIYEISPDEVEDEIVANESLKNKEKMMQKPTIHSKRCRKRILGKEPSSLRLAVKASIKEPVSNISSKTTTRHPSISESKGLFSAAKKIVTHKARGTVIKEGSKNDAIKVVGHPHKIRSPLRKVIPIPKSSRISRSPFRMHAEHSDKLFRKSETDYSSRSKIRVLVKNAHAHKISEKTFSNPVVFSPKDSPHHIIQSPVRKYSKSPLNPMKLTLMRQAVSPAKKITSPLRLVKSPIRRHSRSPVKKYITSSKNPFMFHSRSPTGRKSRSPHGKDDLESLLERHFANALRRHSRSPVRRHSRSPVRRRSRSSVRRRSRSPVRRRSRSPVRRHSRSPVRRHSRSPVRRHSRSPVRRHSRSPVRRHSRSPVRRHSRSPVRRHSRSPVRRHSRSPVRRSSRSSIRRHSRSPIRRYSRSPTKRHSRSPVRRHSRSPVKKRSKSPFERARSPFIRHSRSPYKRYSTSPAKDHRNPYPLQFPNLKHPRNSHESKLQKHLSRSTMHDYEKQLLSSIDSSYSKVRAVSKKGISSQNIKDKFIHTFSPHVRDISDLDPVSDEDESVYFNTSEKHQHVDDIKMSNTSKAVLAQLLQNFSVNNVNQNDPTLHKLLQFIEAHYSELQAMVESQPDPKFGSMNLPKVDTSIKEKSMFLQQYLLSNLAGSAQISGASAVPYPSGLPPTFNQPPFLEDIRHPTYGHTPNLGTQGPSHPVHNQPHIFPPNLNVPPPSQLSHLNQRPQELQAKPKVEPEVIFKDLKATVNKLFGANENALNLEKNKPNVTMYVTEPDPDKWDLNHPNAPRFAGSIGPKSMLHSQGKNVGFCGVSEKSVTDQMSRMYNSNNNPGQFFGNRDRPQPLNVPVPPPDAKVTFCDVPQGSAKGNLFPVIRPPINQSFNPSSSHGVSDVKVSLAQRLASVLVKVGMIDVPAPLLQEMLMKIGAFSSSPPQDIREAEIISILKRLGYLS